MNEYEQQAKEFLEETGTSLIIEFQYTGPYFAGETEKRDVYRFTLKNARGEYSATFGDSVYNTEIRQEAKEARDHKPSAYNILACLDANDPGTFDDFCSDFGYNDQPLSSYPDVMKIYSAIQEQVRGLRRIFSEEELDRLAEIA